MATVRKTPIVQGEIYHVFNRSVGGMPIFQTKSNINRALHLTRMRFSHYNRLNYEARQTFLENLKRCQKLVEIYAFVLMPNHFHFLIKDCLQNGIKHYTSVFQNSFAKYYNIKNERHGAVFQQMFRAVRIENDEQFLHVSRYIHINPLTSFVITRRDDLVNYAPSSFPEYVTEKHGVVNTEMLLKMVPSVSKLEEFTMNQVDYQRKLAFIKHLSLE